MHTFHPELQFLPKKAKQVWISSLEMWGVSTKLNPSSGIHQGLSPTPTYTDLQTSSGHALHSNCYTPIYRSSSRKTPSWQVSLKAQQLEGSLILPIHIFKNVYLFSATEKKSNKLRAKARMLFHFPDLFSKWLSANMEPVRQKPETENLIQIFQAHADDPNSWAVTHCLLDDLAWS